MDGHVQHDGFGRDINYLRIAVTDKCNFRCIYCMPADGVAPRAHDELLSAEEIARFVRLVAGEGIRRVRLTGGEPLVSRRIIPLIRDIRAIPQIEDISLTTNGALLPKLAPQLKDAGLTASTFRSTRSTLRCLERSRAWVDSSRPWPASTRRWLGALSPLRSTALWCAGSTRMWRPLRGSRSTAPSTCALSNTCPSVTSARARIALWTRMRPRSIPSCGTRAIPCRATSCGRASMPGATAAGLGELEPLDINDAPAGAGPARYWHFPGAAGTVGFISAMSNHFCATCNRLRLTADGNVRPCLFSDAEYSVRDALRRGDDMQVLSIWRDAVAHKPQEHAIIEGTQRFMSQIGG